MKHVIRIALFIIGIIVLIQANQYLFNHVNPWLGIFTTIVGIVVLIWLGWITVKGLINQNNN